MGISDEIEVATIVIDKARILEIKATISIAISVKFDASRAMTPTKLKSTAHLVFFFNFFPRFAVVVVAPSSLVALSLVFTSA